MVDLCVCRGRKLWREIQIGEKLSIVLLQITYTKILEIRLVLPDDATFANCLAD